MYYNFDDKSEIISDEQVIELMIQGTLPREKVTLDQWVRINAKQDMVNKEI